jgi:hypothetical protein
MCGAGCLPNSGESVRLIFLLQESGCSKKRSKGSREGQERRGGEEWRTWVVSGEAASGENMEGSREGVVYESGLRRRQLLRLLLECRVSDGLLVSRHQRRRGKVSAEDHRSCGSSSWREI